MSSFTRRLRSSQLAIAIAAFVGLAATTAYAAIFQTCKTGPTYVFQTLGCPAPATCGGQNCGGVYFDTYCGWTLWGSCNPNTCNGSWFVRLATCTLTTGGCPCL